MNNVTPLCTVQKMKPKKSLMRLLPSCSIDVLWSQSPHSRDQGMEPQQRSPGDTHAYPMVSLSQLSVMMSNPVLMALKKSFKPNVLEKCQHLNQHQSDMSYLNDRGHLWDNIGGDRLCDLCDQPITREQSWWFGFTFVELLWHSSLYTKKWPKQC